MGLVQVSKNPFLKGKNPISFSDFLLGKDGILSHFKAELEATPIPLDRLKGVSEVEIKEGESDAVGPAGAHQPASLKERPRTRA